MSGPKVLCLSSSMGLGNVTRDLVVVQEFRRPRPDVEAIWLTMPPNAAFLQEAGKL